MKGLSMIENLILAWACKLKKVDGDLFSPSAFSYEKSLT